MPRQKKSHNLPPEKTLKTMVVKNMPNLYRICYEEGGTVPDELSGTYNSKRVALNAIASYKTKNYSYLHHVRDKENGKIKDKGTE